MRPFTALAVAIALATIGPAFAGEPHEHGHGRAAEHHQAVKDRVTPVSTMRQLVVRQRVTEEVERAVEHRAAETGSNADAARREEASEKAAAANIPLGDIIRNPTPRITQETAIEDFQAVKDARVSMISTFRQPVVKERVTEEVERVTEEVERAVEVEVERAVEREVERAVEHHDVARAVEHKATDAGSKPGANDVANAGTPGYGRSSVNFQDVFATTALGGSGRESVGGGVTLAEPTGAAESPR